MTYYNAIISVHTRRMIAMVCMLMWCVVSAFADKSSTFSIVSNISQLCDNDEVIIVSRDYGVTLSLETEKGYVKPCQVNVSDDGLTAELVSEQTAVFTLEKKSTKWRFKNAEKGWLWAADRVSYELSYNTEKPSYKSNLAEIEIQSDGNAIIKFSVKNYKYLKYNGSDRFACYPSSSSVECVQIYRRQRQMDSLSLAEDNDNTTLLAEANGACVGNLTLGRSFADDGGFYSLCLPFSVTSEQMRINMPGAVLFRLVSVECDGTGKVLFFFDKTEAVEAGVPYLLRAMAGNIDNPVFHNVSIEATKPCSVSMVVDGATFKFDGTFSPVALAANGITRFVSSDGSRLVCPNSDDELKAFRAYFVLPDIGLKTGWGEIDKEFKIVIGKHDDYKTGIDETVGMKGDILKDYRENAGMVFDAEGKPIVGKKHGIVIRRHKKSL